MDELLKKLNKFTRREHSADEVYIFDVVLCDNDVDRDGEAFSIAALHEIQKLFIGVTGIFDHNPKGSNQTARIFDAAVVADETRKTRTGAAYTCVKANAYMVRTESNADLIREIDGGIKKEVSISCAAEKKLCSVCGADRKTKQCSHLKGRKYGGAVCHNILDGITDGYEWSFVAVPAQVNAGVVKHCSQHCNNFISDLGQASEVEGLDELVEDLKSEVLKLAFFNGISKSQSSSLSEKSAFGNNGQVSTLLSTTVEKMSPIELLTLKKSLQKGAETRFKPQLPDKSNVKNQVKNQDEFAKYKM